MGTTDHLTPCSLLSPRNAFVPSQLEIVLNAKPRTASFCQGRPWLSKPETAVAECV